MSLLSLFDDIRSYQDVSGVYERAILEKLLFVPTTEENHWQYGMRLKTCVRRVSLNDAQQTIGLKMDDIISINRPLMIQPVHVHVSNRGIPGSIGWHLRSLLILNLSQFNLTGELPESLALLPFLTTLQLSNNALTGSILTSANTSKLPRSLTFLDLSNNGLSGSLGLALDLPECVMLFLHNNEFSGGIPEQMNMPRVTRFSAHHNFFTGRIPESIRSLPRLQLLNLERCRLTGPTASYRLPASLKWLYLDHNPINLPEDVKDRLRQYNPHCSINI
jgi:hypothetical protein